MPKLDVNCFYPPNTYTQAVEAYLLVPFFRVLILFLNFISSFIPHTPCFFGVMKMHIWGKLIKAAQKNYLSWKFWMTKAHFLKINNFMSCHCCMGKYGKQLLYDTFYMASNCCVRKKFKIARNCCMENNTNRVLTFIMSAIQNN